MNLTIDSATIGYDVEGLKKVYTDIQTNLIDDAINTLKTNSQSLRNNVDTYWIGASAEAFKSKIDSDTDIVINRLLEIRSGLQNEIDQMMYNVNNSDVVLAENIRGKTVSISYGNSSGNKVNLTDQINGLANSNPMHSYHTNSNYATQVNQQTKSFDPALFATGATVALGFVEGVGQTAEAIVDTAAILGTGVASIFTGIYDGTNYLMGNETHVTSSMWNDTMGFTAKKYVSGAFDKMYEETKIGQAIKNNSWAFDTVRGVSNGIGYTAGVVALTVATAGAGGLATGGAASASAAMTSISAGQLAITAGAAGFGRGTEKAWSEGATLTDGLKQGAATGAWEATQFYVGGKIAGISPFGNELANTATRIGLDTLDGAAEGFVQPALDGIYKDGTYAELFEEAGGWKNVATQAAVGAIGSTIGEAGSLAKNLMAGGEAAGAGVAAKKVDVDPNEAYKQLFAESESPENYIAKITEKSGNPVPEASVGSSLDFTPVANESTGSPLPNSSIGATRESGRVFSSYDEFLRETKAEAQAWEQGLKATEYVSPQGKTYTMYDVMSGYIGESPSKPGNYQIVNSVQRAFDTAGVRSDGKLDVGQMIDVLCDKTPDGKLAIDANGCYTMTTTGSFGGKTVYTYDPIADTIKSPYGTGLGDGGSIIGMKGLVDRVTSETRAMNEAMASSALKENTVLYRGVDSNFLESRGISMTDTPEIIMQKLTKNGTADIQSQSFLSATPDSHGGFTHKSVQLIMDTKAGTPVANFATINAREKEVLISAGQSYKVTSVTCENGKIKIYMSN